MTIQDIAKNKGEFLGRIQTQYYVVENTYFEQVWEATSRFSFIETQGDKISFEELIYLGRNDENFLIGGEIDNFEVNYGLFSANLDMPDYNLMDFSGLYNDGINIRYLNNYFDSGQIFSSNEYRLLPVGALKKDQGSDYLDIDNVIYGQDFLYNTLISAINSLNSLDTDLDNAINIIIGTSSDDDLSGTLANDSIDALAGDDTIFVGEGEDVIYGGTGKDIFHFDLATVYDGIDTIKDFSMSDVDVLDFRNVFFMNSAFNGGMPAYFHDAAAGYSELIDDFINLTDVGSDTYVSIDLDGSDNGVNFIHVATLEGVTGLDEFALEASYQLPIATSVVV